MMKCEDLEILLSAYIDDELCDDERSRVEEHLISCKACGDLLADFSQIHALYGEFEELQAPKGFRERVTQRIDRSSHSWLPSVFTRPVLRYAASCLLLLLLVGGLWFGLLREHIVPQTEETLLAGEIEVFAEDVLFGDGSVEDIELFSSTSSEDEAVADSILDNLFIGDSDTSHLLQAAGLST